MTKEVDLVIRGAQVVSPDRIIGVNVGLGHHCETDPAGDWLPLSGT